MITRVSVFLAILMLLILGLGMCKKSSPTEPEPTPHQDIEPQPGTKLNNIAINFTAKDQNGGDVSLNDFYGKVILVNLSADWCGPCRTEATHLEDLFQEYKQRGFHIITALISGDPSVWAQDYGLTFPVLDDNNQAIWDLYGEGSVPLNIVLDRTNVIRYKDAGYSESSIRYIIEKYL